MVVRAIGWILVALCGGAAAASAQALDARDAGALRARSGPSAAERMIRMANAWDANSDQVYTCDEWKRFVNDIFSKADRNRDGFVDAQEFPAIQAATAQFKDSGLGYFDDNGDGRLSRAEFVDKPNPFFLQFDRDRDCRVTLEEILAAAGSQVHRPRPPAGGSR